MVKELHLLFTVERSYSSATMNGVTLLHPEPGGCPNSISSSANTVSAFTPATPLRQHRLSPTRLSGANGYSTRAKLGKEEKKKKSVKIWLLRGMMQVGSF